MAKVLAIPFRTVTWSSADSESATTGIDSVIGAWAGIGWGLASTLVVLATTGIDVVRSETWGTGAGATTLAAGAGVLG